MVTENNRPIYILYSLFPEEETRYVGKLEPGEYIIGRLPHEKEELINRYKLNWYQPYLIDNRTGEIITAIGPENLLISRYHAYIAIKEDGSLIIKDHGRDGSGTTNGTYITDISSFENVRMCLRNKVYRKIEKGQSIELRLDKRSCVGANLGGEDGLDVILCRDL